MEEEKKSKSTNKNIKWISALIAVVVVVFVVAGALGVIPNFGSKKTDKPVEQTVVENKDEKVYNEDGIEIANYVDDDPFYTDHISEEKAEEDYDEGFNIYDHHYDNTLTYDSYDDVIANVPEYTDNQYDVINQSKSFFTDDDISENQHIEYSNLDSLGRAGAAFGIIGPETRTKEDRLKDLSVVTPSGWTQVNVQTKYGITFQPEDFPFLWTRSHLIAYSLGGGEVETKDIVTGTYAFNTAMLEFEYEMINYIDTVGGPILYRVTPIYKGNEVICRGVLMEAYDIESEGRFINMCVFVHNVQPGFSIDYNTGKETKIS